MPTYKLAELLKTAGVTASQMDYWLRLGVIVPLKDAKSSGDHRLFSIENIIGAALARVLTEAGMSDQRLDATFTLLREKLAKLPAEHRPLEMFVSYVAMVDAIVTIVGPGPNYATWQKDCAAAIRSWRRRPPLDEQILTVLAGARAHRIHSNSRERDEAR